MYVKQIGMEEALRLAGKGREIMVMVPGIEGENGWKDHTLDTLAGMLEGCMFFRKRQEVGGEGINDTGEPI